MCGLSVRLPIRRLDPGLPLPAYARPGDAGLDLHARTDARIEPGERVLVGTGVAVAIPAGHIGLVHPRSGLAARYGVTHLLLDENRTAPFDRLYRGEESRPYLVPLGDLAGGLRLFAIDLAEREP